MLREDGGDVNMAITLKTSVTETDPWSEPAWQEAGAVRKRLYSLPMVASDMAV
jgi:hypothetical protein